MGKTHDWGLYASLNPEREPVLAAEPAPRLARLAARAVDEELEDLQNAVHVQHLVKQRGSNLYAPIQAHCYLHCTSSIAVC